LLESHAQSARGTIAAIPGHQGSWAAEFGVIEAAPDGTVMGFHVKSAAMRQTMPGDPERVFFPGNYIFPTQNLLFARDV